MIHARTTHLTQTTAPVPDNVSACAARCRIPTSIKRATGSSERFALSAVRALPLRYRGRRTSDPGFRHNVVLLASDGHQAVCVFTEGAVERPTLIPGEVLPTRQHDRISGVTLDGDVWRAKHREDVPALDAGSEFPPIGPVLWAGWREGVGQSHPAGAQSNPEKPSIPRK